MDRNTYDKSKQNLKNEIDSLHEKLTEKMNEYGSKIRNINNTDDNQLTAYLNKVKINRLKLENILTEIDGTKEPDWTKFREDAEKTVERVRYEFERNVPTPVG